MTEDLFGRHEATLTAALDAIGGRGYWSPYPEAPSGRLYGETAPAEGEAAFKVRLNRPFPLEQSGVDGWIGAEISPYGDPLGVTYPLSGVDDLIGTARQALPAWRDAGPRTRTGVCLEILSRLNQRSFEIAHAVMHTTGQAFAMAFQAGGPHAQDRGLEAVATAWRAMSRVPSGSLWEKPQGRGEPLRLSKQFRIAPRGVALVVGCATFPTWNGYPGLFASLVTGNPVIVKPHPAAVLPLAITVSVCRDVLASAGFSPDLVTLLVDRAEAPVTREIALRPEIRLIDFTGSTGFGDWLEQNARQARVFTEKAGVNVAVVAGTADFAGMARNIAFSLSLYSGQMCTTTQTIYVPRDGIETDQGHKSFEEVAAAIAGAVETLLADPARAVEITGAIQSGATLARIAGARALGRVLLDSRDLVHPRYPKARVVTPLLLTSDEAGAPEGELFGPITFLVATEGVGAAIEAAASTVRTRGALTAAIHATDRAVLARMEEACLEAGVALSENLTGGVFINQSAAFSDYHGTGANPAANAALCDDAFVADRFHVLQVRRPAS
ncbi:MAG: phenylacetic acid degradation protein PaaN [Telmatospirillum sp.]|nr:phenylacetic acid degradation protein PaaN [Telmatospirillum sp.]